jgi:hypothetical protein
MSKLKTIPAFKTEADGRKFWETHDSTDCIDWSKTARVRFPNLKPSTTAPADQDVRKYQILIDRIRAASCGQPLWKVERFWPGF